jgi:hypothetical protein
LDLLIFGGTFLFAISGSFYFTSYIGAFKVTQAALTGLNTVIKGIDVFKKLFPSKTDTPAEDELTSLGRVDTREKM